jgi:hypothetical protein
MEMGICVTNSREVGNGDVILKIAEGPRGPAEVKFTVKKDMDRADFIIAATEAYHARKPDQTTD